MFFEYIFRTILNLLQSNIQYDCCRHPNCWILNSFNPRVSMRALVQMVGSIGYSPKKKWSLVSTSSLQRWKLVVCRVLYRQIKWPRRPSCLYQHWERPKINNNQNVPLFSGFGFLFWSILCLEIVWFLYFRNFSNHYYIY